MKPPIILMIDSNGEAVELARFALWRSNYRCVLQWYDDADAAIHRLLYARRMDADHALPRMIFIDPGMMENNGEAFITAMKAQRATRAIPIVVLADADYPPAMRSLMEAGAAEYVQRPHSMEEFMALFLDCIERWGRSKRRAGAKKPA